MNGYESTALHEAGHLAAAVVTGRRPYFAQVGGLPYPNIGAIYVSNVEGRTPEDIRAHALVSLAGGIAAAERDWPPHWKLNPHGRGDERALAVFVDYLARVEDRDPKRVYDDLVIDAYNMGSRPTYSLLESTFATALTRLGMLDARGIGRVCKIVLSVNDTEEKADGT